VLFAQSSQRKNRFCPTCYSGHGVLLPSRLKGTPLNDHILNAIDEEIARLRQARAILGGESQGATRKSSAAPTSEPKTRRQLSAKARHAIAEGQRKRWAKLKSQKKPAVPAAAAEKETAAG